MKKINEYLKDTNVQITLISVVIGLSLFIYNNYVLNNSLVNVFAILLVLIGPATLEYIRYNKMKDIEERFPDFLRDISENISAGMTLPQAIKALKETDYGNLSPHVKRMVIQMDWGVTFEDVLRDFSEEGTPLIKRTVSTVIETYSGGGNLSEVLRSIGRSISEVNKLRKERYSGVYSQVISGYLIFFVFLGILVSLQRFLIPSLLSISAPELGLSASSTLDFYSDIFQWLVLIQGFFSGLVIGKMSEGNIISGLKHCLILMLVGYTVLVLFI
ncbi:MAG: type II secretion system F family protein [Candidatus Aenigmarchaeota archaeon]|nr:type II secretion system F family protein [Candidatus Aenigmarchaeota archaeon]